MSTTTTFTANNIINLRDALAVYTTSSSSLAHLVDDTLVYPAATTQSERVQYWSLSLLTIYGSPEYDPTSPPALPTNGLLSFKEHDTETVEFMAGLRAQHSCTPPGLCVPNPSPEKADRDTVTEILDKAEARATFSSFRAATSVSSIRQTRQAVASRLQDWIAEWQKGRTALQESVYWEYMTHKDLEGQQQLLEQGTLAVKPGNGGWSIWIPAAIVMEEKWWRSDRRGYLSWMDAVKTGSTKNYAIPSVYSTEKWCEVARFCRGEVTLASNRTRELIDALIQELQNWQLWSRLYAYSVGLSHGGPISKVLSTLSILSTGVLENGRWLPATIDASDLGFAEVL